ncbi:MAG: DUF3857 domain-containing protein [Planctomycetales bacterium]|nr:DUF3857 domain-containing protein [Planctomycetales bacterium]
MIVLFLAEATRPGAYANLWWIFAIPAALLLFIAIWRCIALAQRPTTSGKSMAALATVLATALVAIIGLPLPRYIFLAEAVAALAAFDLLLALVMGVSILAAIVLAIWGLIQLGNRRLRLEQGGRQAVAALCGGAILCLVVLLHVGETVDRLIAEAEPEEPIEATPQPIIEPPITPKPAINELDNATRSAEPAPHEVRKPVFDAHGEWLVSQPFNFRYLRPATGWLEMPPGQQTNGQSWQWRHMRSDIVMVLVAEEIGDVSPSIYTDALLLSIESRGGKNVRATLRQPRAYGTLQGEFSIVEFDDGALPTRCESWSYAVNGFGYRITLVGPDSQREKIRELGHAWFGGLEIIDAERRSQVNVMQQGVAYESAPFGYRVNFEGTKWSWGESYSQHLPAADMVAQRGLHELLIVHAFDLAGLSPPADVLHQILLERCYVADLIGPAAPLRLGDASGMMSVAGDEALYEGRAYRFASLQAHGVAYLIAVAVDTARVTDAQRQADYMLTESLELFEFIDPAGAIPYTVMHEQRLFAQGSLLNEIGIHYDSLGDSQSALRCYEPATRLLPDEVVILENAITRMFDLSRHRDIVQLLDERTRAVRQSNDLQVYYALALQKMNRNADAIRVYDRLFASGYRNREWFEDFLALLLDENQNDKAIQWMARYRQGDDSVDLLVLQTRVLGAAGKYDDAVKLVAEQIRQHGIDETLGLALADAYDYAEKHDKMLKTTDVLLARGFDSAQVHYTRGLALLALERFDDSRKALEAALAKAPGDQQTLAMLEHVSGLLGQGDNRQIRTPIEPVVIPSSVLNASVADKAPREAHELGAYYVRRIQAYAFDPGKEFRTTTFAEVKIVNQQGPPTFNTLEWTFDPLSEEIYVNYVRVFDADGALVASGKVDDYYVRDERGSLVSQDRVVHVPVPALRPGYRLQYMLTRREPAAPERFPFTQHFFSTGLPVQHSAVVLNAPQGGVHRIASDGVTHQRVERSDVYQLFEPLRYAYEPLQGEVTSFLPYLELGDTSTTWAEQGRVYLDLVAERLQIDDSIRRLAASLIRQSGSDEERVTALVRHVQREYRYQGIEFGRRARLMNPAAQIVHNKYGDCKDHSLLLYQLLRASGQPAHLVLVNSGGEVREPMPSLDQFDHMIVYLPDSQGGRFMDCTDKTTDLAFRVPSGLARKKVLILDPQNIRLATIPDYRVEKYDIHADRNVLVLASGDLEIEERVSFHGYLSGSMRGYLRDLTTVQRRTEIESRLANGGRRVRLEKVDVTNLDPAVGPVAVSLRYQVQGAMHRSGGSLVGRLPAPWEEFFLDPGLAPDRKTPFEVTMPMTVYSQVTVESAPTLGRPTVANAKAGQNTQFGKSVAKISDAGQQGVKIQAVFQRSVGKFPAKRYDEYRQVVQMARELMGPLVQVPVGQP